MQACELQVGQAVEGGLDGIEAAARGCVPGRSDLGRDGTVFHQPVACDLSWRGAGPGQAFGKVLLTAHAMQAGQQSADPAQHLGIFQLRPAAALARRDGQALALVMKESGPTAQRPWRCNRYLCGGELGGEDVLLEDLRVAPARRAVELGDRHIGAFRVVLQMQHQHSVLEGIELQQPTVGAQACGVEGVEHELRRQVAETEIGGRVRHPASVAGLVQPRRGRWVA